MRIKYLDFLKMMSIVGVVLIHAAAPLIDNYNVGSTYWWVGNIYDSLVRISIPIFLW